MSYACLVHCMATRVDELKIALEFYKEEVVEEAEVDQAYAHAHNLLEDLELRNMLRGEGDIMSSLYYFYVFFCFGSANLANLRQLRKHRPCHGLSMVAACFAEPARIVTFAFQNHAQAAQAQMKKIKDLQKWIADYESLEGATPFSLLRKP